MRKPPRATSATALVTTSPLVPVTASFLCWGVGAGVADDVGTGAGVVDGVGADGVGVGLADGVGVRLGLDVTDGVGTGV